MNFLKADYPIQEYDPEKVALIEPGRNQLGIKFPERCVMTFLGYCREIQPDGWGEDTI